MHSAHWDFRDSDASGCGNDWASGSTAELIFMVECSCCCPPKSRLHHILAYCAWTLVIAACGYLYFIIILPFYFLLWSHYLPSKNPANKASIMSQIVLFFYLYKLKVLSQFHILKSLKHFILHIASSLFIPCSTSTLSIRLYCFFLTAKLKLFLHNYP